MAKQMPETPMLDQLEDGPWPSFVTGLKHLANDEGKPYAPMMKSLLGQLEHSYQNRKGYWKGGTIGVRGYGGGVIPRFSEVASEYPESAEFHTMRIMPPAGMHYDTKTLRTFCDIWEKYGSGLIAFHGQSGDIMFQGVSSANIQACFDELNEFGFDLGGAGASFRTSMSCVGSARCEQSNYDEARAMRSVVNAFLDDMHRPSLPYKFKAKFSGCANDCVNASQRSDFAVIGTWRDDIKVNQEEIKNKVKELGRKGFNDQVVNMCPTRALSLNDDDTLEIDNKSCVHCMHCINVCTKALSPGDDKGVTILLGGKRTLKIGDLIGSCIVPFMKLESDEDFDNLVDLVDRCVEFFADNALEHERTGEMIERIGLVNLLEGVGLEVDPNMVSHPRTSSFFRSDDWDEQAEKWNRRKAASAAAE